MSVKFQFQVGLIKPPASGNDRSPVRIQVRLDLFVKKEYEELLMPLQIPAVFEYFIAAIAKDLEQGDYFKEEK